MKYETAIKEIKRRTYNVTSLRFPRPEGLDYKPGQFFFVTLKHNDKELRKHFSFSSSPTENDHIEFTKKLSDSEFSQTMKDAKVGDWARIDAPYGSFTFEGETPKIALLGGGIGITPFISICKYATDKGLNNKITLFYGCRTEQDIVFRKEFEELAQKNKNLKLIFSLNEPTPDWRGATGNINAEMVKRELPDYEETVFYACGPPPMVKAMEALVGALGLSKEKLKLEYFTGYA
ncbi:MAG: FAD-dependent oxidoreductase [Candidatus Bathyarchaeota archaeon]|nr:FAD-dependent oxidoreductase [Candidatus Bathyarchaeota archaeon]